MIEDSQIQSAHDYMLGITHAQLGFSPAKDNDEYLEAFSIEYEQIEKLSAIDELPF